jgi:hypothetical protein
MSKVIRLCAVAFLFAIASGTAQASIYFDVDQDNFETNGASSISISVYLAADSGTSVDGLTADYEFLTSYGLSSAGVRLTRVGGPANPPLIDGAAANPAFVADYGGGGGFEFEENLGPDDVGLVVSLDLNRGSFDGFGVQVGEAEEVVVGGLYRVLLGTFAFTVPAGSLEGDVTTYQLSDFDLGTSDTLSLDGSLFGVELDPFIGEAEFTITTTPEPASCVAWTGLMLLAVSGRYYRLRKRRVSVGTDHMH